MRKLLITWILIWITVFCQQQIRQATVNETSRQLFFYFVFHLLPWCYPTICLLLAITKDCFHEYFLKQSHLYIPVYLLYTDWVTACQVPTAHFNKSSKYVWFYCLLLPQHQLWSIWCGLPAIEPQLFEAAFPSLSTENAIDIFNLWVCSLARSFSILYPLYPSWHLLFPQACLLVSLEGHRVPTIHL